MNTEKELPKIDLPENWIAGTDITLELLSLYANYPVRLKCEIFAYIQEGEIDVTVNTNKLHLKPNDLATLLPGSIFQIKKAEGNLKIYFLGFSSDFVNRTGHSRALLDTMLFTLGRPVVSLSDFGSKLLLQYFQVLFTLFENPDTYLREELAANIYNDIHQGISILYKDKGNEKIPSLTKSEQICRTFAQLVVQHYGETRNVSWYAQKLGITHAHLCSVVKQVTGRTCIDIIASMVIMDAKSQLKSTKLSIQAISDSLNFANMSFFGKYFKRNVGMSPLEYRNNG